MNLERLILRMALWMRRPPSLQRIILFAAIVAIGLAVVAIEKAGLWPSALTLDKPSKHMRLPRF